MSKYKILAVLLSRLGLDEQSVASSRAETPEPTTSLHPLTESFDKVHPPLMPPPPFLSKPIKRQIEYYEPDSKAASSNEQTTIEPIGALNTMEGGE